MTPSFNLADEPWIPIIFQNGRYARVGLDQLYSEATRIADLSVLPHQRVSMMRLLLCLCYAAQEKNPDWENLYPSIHAYLEKWRDFFWLYHPSFPFLQLANLENESGPTPFSKLNFNRAAGNNKMFFDHEGEKYRPDDGTLALDLLTYQCFSFPGRISTVKWNGKSTKRNNAPKASQAPCLVASMLHTFIRGKNLLETLRMNYVPASRLERFYNPMDAEENVWLGRPLWEMIPRDRDDKINVDNATKTFLGRMVPLSRAVRIQADSLLNGEALLYTDKNINFREPTATLIAKGESLKYMSYDPNKAIWRELPGLLEAVIATSDTGGSRGPLALLPLRNQRSAGWEYELVVIGTKPNNAKFLDMTESVYTLKPFLLDRISLAYYQEGVKKADSKKKQLENAVKKFLENLGIEKTNKNASMHRAKLMYWTQIEQNIKVLFDLAGSNDEEQCSLLSRKWDNILDETAEQIYNLICGDFVGRNARGWAVGLSCLKKTSKGKQGGSKQNGKRKSGKTGKNA